MNAYIYEERIDQQTFEIEQARPRKEIEGLTSKLESQHIPGRDLEQVLSTAQKLMADLPSYWNRLEPEKKPAFLTAMFPTGLSFADEAIGTAETRWIFTLTTPIRAAEEVW